MSPFPYSLRVSGGDERDRTDDPLLAKQVLSQLSYTPASDHTSLKFRILPFSRLSRTLKIKQRAFRNPFQIVSYLLTGLLR